MKTLQGVFDQLKPYQQEFIIVCVQKYGTREHFHRGLLPFLPTHEAISALKEHLEWVVGKHNREMKAPVVGEKFLRQLISKLGPESDYLISPDEKSVELTLSDAKLKTAFAKRFGRSFCVRVGYKQGKSVMAQLTNIGPNKWKLTCPESTVAHMARYYFDHYKL